MRGFLVHLYRFRTASPNILHTAIQLYLQSLYFTGFSMREYHPTGLDWTRQTPKSPSQKAQRNTRIRLTVKQ